MEQVAITGIGVVSAVGMGYRPFVDGLLAGDVAVKPTPWADSANGVYALNAAIAGFDPDEHLDPKIVAGTDRFAQYALIAASEALAHRSAPFDATRTGVVMGTSMAGARALLEAQRTVDVDGPAAAPRKIMIQAWPNMAAGQVAMQHGLHGPSLTVSTACASSLDAIGLGARLIESGAADVIVAGGTDSNLHETIFLCQTAYGMAKQVEDPNRAVLPFDVDRVGIVEGEGAGIVILERRSLAEARGATIHGFVRGHHSVCEAYHPSSPDPSGQWEVAAMRGALADAGVDAATVDAAIAHGTGTPVGDIAELRALNDVFGDRDTPLPVTSIKGHIGHTGGAAGVMGLIAGLHAMSDGTLVHTANSRNIEPEAQVEVVVGAPKSVTIETLLVNGFGFGGQDSALVVTRS